MRILSWHSGFVAIRARVLCVLMVGLAGCYSGISDERLRVVGVDSVRAWLADEDRVVMLVDVRSAGEFAAGHLPGAVNKPLPSLQRFDRSLEGADVVVVYGSGWEDDRVPAAAKRLMAYEIDDVYDYRGGVERWVETGGALEGGE
ncbi:rhodanese-like domain-containing protein [Mucisphaera sp.]|uniref:rhodanese-like domain-containing protein n=1 Tax=Mucisphaera sp. TaxID=2913024 RepID=UPI003D0FA2B3